MDILFLVFSAMCFWFAAQHANLAGWWEGRKDMGRETAYDGTPTAFKERANMVTFVFEFGLGAASLVAAYIFK